MRLTIVGAGVAGSALFWEARSRGIAVDVYAEAAPAASRAALAIIRKAWLPSDVPKSAVAEALDVYRARGCEVVEGAVVTRWNSDHGKMDPDWYAVRPDPFLVAFEQREVDEDWVDPHTDWTVHCTSTSLVDPTQTTYGATWLHFQPRRVVSPGSPRLRSHMWAPYRSADLVRYDDSVRLGSSASRSLAGCRREASRIMQIAVEQEWITHDAGWVSVIGIRANRPDHITVDRERHHATLGGLHRLGWSLAPYRARQLLEAIE